MKLRDTIEEKNKSEYYTLNGKELREALGRKPEDSLEDYKENLCVPMVVRRDFEDMSDKEWTEFSNSIINDDGIFNDLDYALNQYLDKMGKDIIEKEELSSLEDMHTLDVFIESYNNLKIRISEEDYKAIQKEAEEGNLTAQTIDDIIYKNLGYIVNEDIFAAKYVDATLDSKGDINADIAAKNFPIPIEDKLMPSSQNIEAEDLKKWREVAYRFNTK